MNLADALEKLLHSFEAYYNIKREEVVHPFAAEAVFHTHDEQYFLVRSARIAESISNEYVYFATEETLDVERLQLLDETAWNHGLSQIKPNPGHRNSDVTLIILAEKIQPEAFNMIRKIKHYKSYRHSFWGWSNYRLIALELNTGRLTYNRQGQSLKKLVSNILK